RDLLRNLSESIYFVPKDVEDEDSEFDATGKIVASFSEIQQRIFVGGVDPALRSQVWRFCLDYIHGIRISKRKAIKAENTLSIIIPHLEERLQGEQQDSSNESHQDEDPASVMYEDAVSRTQLRDILITYVCSFPGSNSIGYVQGMSDLCSSFLIICDGDDVDAFCMFAHYMESKPFYIFFYDVGTHVNLLRLKNGRFLVLSAVTLTGDTKAQIDALTHDGDLIEAVIATNPAGSVESEEIRKLWEPEVELRIPAGCEFNDPKPELTNHFSGIIAYYRASSIVICDDAFSVSAPSSMFSSMFHFASIFFSAYFSNTTKSSTDSSAAETTITFHPAMPSQALLKTPKAARQFYDWVVTLTQDWNFDSMASAHGTFVVGGAKQALLDCLENARKSLSDHSVANGGDPI
ncbi:hypothetical protein HK100_006182, partial [Physocladia obscura]